MNRILTHHNVGPQFLDLLMSFGTGSKESEAGPGGMVTRRLPDGSHGNDITSLDHKFSSDFRCRTPVSSQLC